MSIVSEKINKFNISVSDIGLYNTFKIKIYNLAFDFIKRRVYSVIFFFKKLSLVEGRTLCKVKGNGSLMLLNVKDRGISRELLITGFHEKNSTNFIKTQVSKGMNILEIGANIGYYSLMEASIIGKTGFIYAFEPDPVNMLNLQINMSINKYSNVEYYNKAVGNENKKSDFYMSNYGNLGSMIQRGDDMCEYNKIEVDMVRLDDFFKDKKIDYFRMDVEGFEMEVIKSMNDILSSPNPPKGMFIEVHSELLHKVNSSALDFVNNLQKYGYNIIKAFYRGGSDFTVDTNNDFESHPLREKGYWEMFFTIK